MDFEYVYIPSTKSTTVVVEVWSERACACACEGVTNDGTDRQTDRRGGSGISQKGTGKGREGKGRGGRQTGRRGE